MSHLPSGASPTAEDDRSLLSRFAANGDEAAFATLVNRHGPVVLGVCRRVLRDSHLADDAFQATFLVLAKKPKRALASPMSWLFGVARRVALAARRKEHRHANRLQKAQQPEPDDSKTPDWDDLLRTLDEELERLPEKLRAPILECFFHERTQDEAAKSLGWSLSTLRRRLERAKELLRYRLIARGATLAAGLLAGAFASTPVLAVVPPRQASAAVSLGLLAREGGPVSSLAEGEFGMGWPPKWIITTATVVAVVGLSIVAIPDVNRWLFPSPVQEGRQERHEETEGDPPSGLKKPTGPGFDPKQIDQDQRRRGSGGW